MTGVWTVIAVNTFSYDATVLKTTMCRTKEEAELAFYKMCKNYLNDEREYYLNKLILNNEVSYTDIREIAMDEEEFIDYAYEDNDNEKIFTIRKDYDDGDSHEEHIIRMGFTEFGKEQENQYFSCNDDSESVNQFFAFLKTLDI